jgi:hypothetical protein
MFFYPHTINNIKVTKIQIAQFNKYYFRVSKVFIQQARAFIVQKVLCQKWRWITLSF